MISICIPIYNFRVDHLVERLIRQSGKLDVPCEIILIDDCSEAAFRDHNIKLSEYGVRYIQLKENIGRAAIRNRFLEYAQFDHMLFLDCDSLIITAEFLSKYIKSIQEFPDAVHCGGPAYFREAPERNRRLRWKYGLTRECRPAAVRSLQPAKSFMTGNFAIPRKTFEIIRFDERLREYGHEDTLFGLELKRLGIQVEHLDNPVINGYLEENAGYLANTEKGIENLVFLIRNSPWSGELVKEIRLLQVYGKMNRLRFAVGWAFSLVAPLIRYLLKKGVANLFLFDLYKLVVLHEKMTAARNEEGRSIL